MLPNDVVFVGAPIQRRLVGVALGVVLGNRLRGGYSDQTSCQQDFEISPHKSSPIEKKLPASSWVVGSPAPSLHAGDLVSVYMWVSHGFIRYVPSSACY